MSKLSFILGVALLVVAATLAITITAGPRPSTSEEPMRPLSSKQPEARQIGSSNSPEPLRTQRTRRASNRSEHLSVEAPLNHPNHTQLTETAKSVEREALFQLERLTKQLDLTGFQREELFPLLVQGSSQYTPELIVSGGRREAPQLAGSTRDEEISKVLDEEQQEQQIENALDDLLLWQEIIGNLQDRLEEETPRLREPHPPEIPDGSTPGRRRNLRNLLEE